MFKPVKHHPSAVLVSGLCGHHERFIARVYNGLQEIPLRGFSRHLDLDEILAFAATSWQIRKDHPDFFARYIPDFESKHSASRVDLLAAIFQGVLQQPTGGFRVLDNVKTVPLGKEETYRAENPFSRKDLPGRLAVVAEEEWERLRYQLWHREVVPHMFPDAYHSVNQEVDVMAFQKNKYSQTNPATNVACYAMEIARQIKGYEREPTRKVHGKVVSQQTVLNLEACRPADPLIAEFGLLFVQEALAGGRRQAPYELGERIALKLDSLTPEELAHVAAKCGKEKLGGYAKYLPQEPVVLETEVRKAG